jgi:hypothetical protein
VSISSKGTTSETDKKSLIGQPSGTDDVSLIIYLSESSFCTISKSFSRTRGFRATRRMSRTDKMSGTDKVSGTGKMSLTGQETGTDDVSLSIHLSESCFCTMSKSFSRTRGFRATRRMSRSDKMSGTGKVSLTGQQTGTNVISVSIDVSKSSYFVKSMGLAESLTFGRTDRASKSLSIFNSLNFEMTAFIGGTGNPVVSYRFSPSGFLTACSRSMGEITRSQSKSVGTSWEIITASNGAVEGNEGDELKVNESDGESSTPIYVIVVLMIILIYVSCQLLMAEKDHLDRADEMHEWSSG